MHEAHISPIAYYSVSQFLQELSNDLPSELISSSPKFSLSLKVIGSADSLAPYIGTAGSGSSVSGFSANNRRRMRYLSFHASHCACNGLLLTLSSLELVLGLHRSCFLFEVKCIPQHAPGNTVP